MKDPTISTCTENDTQAPGSAPQGPCAENFSKWQSMDRAPKANTPFIGYFSNGEQHIVAIDSSGACYRELDPDDTTWALPSHWMPLPEPPSMHREGEWEIAPLDPEGLKSTARGLLGAL